MIALEHAGVSLSLIPSDVNKRYDGVTVVDSCDACVHVVAALSNALCAVNPSLLRAEWVGPVDDPTH